MARYIYFEDQQIFRGPIKIEVRSKVLSRERKKNKA